MVRYVIAAAALAVLAGLGALVGWLRRRLRVVTVFGDSMRLTLAPGDQLLVRRTPLSQVRVGDIVVLAYPARGPLAGLRPRDDSWLIKRAVATPGDPVPASVLPALSVTPGSRVRDGALLVLGDNRDDSFDSRSFGYVLADDLLGVVLRRLRTGRAEVTALPPLPRPASPESHAAHSSRVQAQPTG